MTPAQRKLRAQMGANALWAKTSDRSAVTAPGRAAAEARFDRMVIENHGVLPPEEHAKRAANYRRAFYAEIQLKSARARSARAAGKQ